jgi:hypothetical protein
MHTETVFVHNTARQQNIHATKTIHLPDSNAQSLTGIHAAVHQPRLPALIVAAHATHYLLTT